MSQLIHLEKNITIIKKSNNSFNKGDYYAQKRNNIKKYKVA